MKKDEELQQHSLAFVHTMIKFYSKKLKTKNSFPPKNKYSYSHIALPHGTITKKKRDCMGNVVAQSENMPSDNSDQNCVIIEYKYDDYGNWEERKVVDSNPNGSLNNYEKRNIYYLDE